MCARYTIILIRFLCLNKSISSKGFMDSFCSLLLEVNLFYHYIKLCLTVIRLDEPNRKSQANWNPFFNFSVRYFHYLLRCLFIYNRDDFFNGNIRTATDNNHAFIFKSVQILQKCCNWHTNGTLNNLQQKWTNCRIWTTLQISW